MPNRKNSNRGFTLLEMLVATAILGIAVAALLGGLSGSLRNASRLSEYDKATIAARQKMEELLVDPVIPRFTEVSGTLTPGVTWRARMMPFDIPPQAGAGAPVVDRIELNASWQAGSNKKTIRLEGYRRGFMRREDFTDGVLRQ